MFRRYLPQHGRAPKRKRRPAASAVAVMALAAGPVWVTVHHGDTLSGIASRYCAGHSNDWTGIWTHNKAAIGGNPNLILPGQKIKVVCEDPPSLLKYGSVQHHAPSPGRVRGVTYGYPNYCGDGDGDGWDVACAKQVTPTGSQGAQPGVVYHGSSAMQACIIARESGGNPDIWNATGHWGLYQFSEQTWTAHGGAASLFGSASVAYQNQVFYSTVAADGYSDWAPYDGC